MSARAELARRVLEDLAHGNLVSFNDAIQLRNWAVTPEDCLTPTRGGCPAHFRSGGKPKPTKARSTPADRHLSEVLKRSPDRMLP